MSKAAFDMYLMSLYKNYNFPVSFVRPCNWFGPYQNLYTIVPKTIIKIKKKEKLYLDGTGLSYRNFIYVTNVCDGILKVIENGKEGEIYHISTDDLLSIKELIELICMKMGYSFNKLIVERPDRIGKDMEYNLDSNKIRKDLGWKPRYTLSEGIDKTIEWIENDWDKLKNMSLEYNFRN
jgi:dTDP-glucose 4,6-dehydratase